MPRTLTWIRWIGMLPCVSALAANAASIAVHVQKKDGKPLAGAVLLLVPESGRVAPVAPARAVVDQLDLTFVPDIVVIPVGSTISFPNTDSVSHQVYSFSNARRFQLPLYRGKPYPPVTFDQVGVVTLGCNIHDNMLAYVVVTDAPFFGRSDAKGAWTTGNVPTGTYRITVWHPLLTETVEREVKIDGAEQSEIAVKLAHGLRPAPITSRPHSWDY